MPSFEGGDSTTELQRGGKSVILLFQCGDVCSDTQSLAGVTRNQGENTQKQQNFWAYTSHEVIVDIAPLRTGVLPRTHSQNLVIFTLVTAVWLTLFSSGKHKLLRQAGKKQTTTNCRAKLCLAILPVALGGC